MGSDGAPYSSVMDALTEIALNLRWSWNHAADDLWEQLDPELWEQTRNPWVMLQTVSRERLGHVVADPKFVQLIEEIHRRRKYREEQTSWFQQAYPSPPFQSVAYFSMEYMLSDALPIYSGGLGNVAGDQLKAASDLGVPVIGVGLLYQVGYFRQRIDADGNQQALYPFNEPGQLPIRPVRQTNGDWLRISLEIPGCRLWIRAWQVAVGRSQLYLLDTNDPANLPEYRGITGELYGGGPELRISQELVLGIGGWRLLRALGIQPDVCHLNEGHAAFAVLERARDYMNKENVDFETALTATRAGTLFTTHTPVAAGFDRFPAALVERNLRGYAQEQLHIPMSELLALGRQNASDEAEPFSMALLAMRGSGAVNGVSRLHGKVSRELFQSSFARWPEDEVPIGSVTNGVHIPIWDSDVADALWTEACGQSRWDGDPSEIAEGFSRIPDARIWTMRYTSRQGLVAFIRERLARQMAGRGATPDELSQIGRIFEPDTLTLGFARRFASYKRPNLLLHNPERLLAILTNAERPVQLVIAGKAHPQDAEGREMIRRWMHFIQRADARSHVVFLSDYDMRLTEHLVQGVDVWLNTPRRPWEACGTSGMKVLVNGCLNLSELDGWWAEAYSPEVGWALGDGREHGDDPAWDAAEAEQLYSVLEREVVPDFYDRDESGIPVRWVQRIRESMARLTPAFSATRSVREYTQKYYVPLAAGYQTRTANGPAAAAEIVRWRSEVCEHWSRVRFHGMHVETEGGEHRFTVQVYLDELPPDAVRVELYAETGPDKEPERHALGRGEQLVAGNTWRYSGSVSATRPASEYTPRILAVHPGVAIPLEAGQILWYH